MIFSILLLLLSLLIVFSIKDRSEKFFSIEQTKPLKGICAIYIVLHHISYNINNLYSPLSIIKYSAFFVVGLFFFISGYGYMSKILRDGNLSLKKDKLKIVKILFPYFIILIVYILVDIFINKNSISNIIGNIVFAKVIGPLWFINIYLVLIFLTYIIFKNNQYNKKIILMFLIVFIYIIALSFLDIPSQWFSSILGYPLGFLIKKYEDSIMKFLSKKWLRNELLLLGLFIITFSLRLFISYFGFNTEIFHGIFRNIIVVVFCILVFTFCYKYSIKSNIFNFIGNISYYLYLIHPFILLLYKNIDINSINILIIVSLSILLSYILKTITNMFLIGGKR